MLVPIALLAVIVNVYDVPFVNPVTIQDVLTVVHVFVPGLDVTVYEVIIEPPLLAGAEKETVA